MTSFRWFAVVASASVLAAGVAACGDDEGTIRIDGSSTVAPLSEAMAELFGADNPDVRLTVGTSGTGGGFEKFCSGETTISDASRAIEPDEVETCERAGISFEEVRVVTDALTIVVNPENPVDCLTTDQLKAVWGPGSELSNWSEIPGLEEEFDADLQLFGPGTDSGTFDYFTAQINGKAGASRTDYNNAGEDDNATVNGVKGAPGGIGYFGFSYFQENEGSLKALEVDGGEGCVAPSAETAQKGEYVPLSRPLFIYPSGEALEDEAAKAFVYYYLENVNDVAESVGFIPLTEAQLQASWDAVAALG